MKKLMLTRLNTKQLDDQVNDLIRSLNHSAPRNAMVSEYIESLVKNGYLPKFKNQLTVSDGDNSLALYVSIPRDIEIISQPYLNMVWIENRDAIDAYEISPLMGDIAAMYKSFFDVAGIPISVTADYKDALSFQLKALQNGVDGYLDVSGYPNFIPSKYVNNNDNVPASKLIGVETNNSVFFSFGGQLSKKADLEALEVAKRLQKNNRFLGYSREAIERETGWFMWGDGKWRFEFSDDKAELVDIHLDLDELRKDIENKLIIDVLDEDTQYCKGTYYRENLGELRYWGDKDEIIDKALDGTYKHIKRRSEFISLKHIKPYKSYTVGEIIKHDEMFEHYPLIRNTPVEFRSLDDFHGRVINVGGIDKIEINISWINDSLKSQPYEDLKQKVMSLMLHELQHVIQRYEGFARGGNPSPEHTSAIESNYDSRIAHIVNEIDYNLGRFSNEIYEYGRLQIYREEVSSYIDQQSLIRYANHDRPSSVWRHIRNLSAIIHSKDERLDEDLQRDIQYTFIPKRKNRNEVIRDYAFKLAKLYRQKISDVTYQSLKNLDEKPSNLYARIDRKLSNLRKTLSVIDDARYELKRLKKEKGALDFLTDDGAYRRTAGEVEARLVQARMNLTKEERKNRPIRLDLDVTESDIVYRVPQEKALIAADIPFASIDKRITKEKFVSIIETELPKLKDAIAVGFARSDRGENGSLVWVDGGSDKIIDAMREAGVGEEVIARCVADKVYPHGFYSTKNSNTYLVAENITSENAIPVFLHEMIHGRGSSRIDMAAAKLLEKGVFQSDSEKTIIERAKKSLAADGQLDNVNEYAAYIIESALMEFGQNYDTALSSNVTKYIESNISSELADFLRAIIKEVKQFLIKYNLVAQSAIGVVDLIEYAKKSAVHQYSNAGMNDVALVDNDIAKLREKDQSRLKNKFAMTQH